MSKANEFMDFSCEVLQTIMREERENIEKAADAVRKTMERGGMLYTFGTGHSTMLCCEPYSRAGGLIACYPILDDRFAVNRVKSPEERFLERESGLTKEIFSHCPIQKGDTMFVFCYGGKNATSIEACLLCKEMGVTSIGISSVEHALCVGTAHESGLLVHQACDISIDNHGPAGDAALDFGDFKACPVSTIVGAAIVQAVTARAIELMLEDGFAPEVLISANLPQGDAHNVPLYEKYRKIIPFI